MTQNHLAQSTSAPTAQNKSEISKQNTAEASNSKKQSGIIYPKDICERFNWSRTTLWRRVNSGDFPAPIDLGGKQKGWPESDPDKWLAARIAARDEPAA